MVDGERVNPREGSRSRNAEFAKWISGAKMHVFATSAAERTSAGPKAAAEAGLLGVARLSGVVGRCCNVPQNVGWIADWVPQPRGPIQRDPAPSRLRGGRRETKKMIDRRRLFFYGILSPCLFVSHGPEFMMNQSQIYYQYPFLRLR